MKWLPGRYYDSLERAALALGRLSARQWQLLLSAWALLLLVDVGLRVMPFHRLQWLAQRLNRPREPIAPDSEERIVSDAARCVRIASRYQLGRMRCLQRSLVLQALLGRCGVAATLRIGVHREGGALHAHAWLERCGVPIGEPVGVEQQFGVLDEQRGGW